MERSGSRKGGSQCTNCSTKWSVFRRKKCCSSCKNYFCHVCIIRRPDKKMCCKKCQVLTATPLNKNDLLNLRSRDLVNYLSSKHISTSGCVEKEDLVDLVMKTVDEGKSPNSVSNAESNSHPNSPSTNSASSAEDSGQPPTRLGTLLYDNDGIRIFGFDASETGDSYSSSLESVNSEVLNESEWVLVSGRTENSPNPHRGNSHGHQGAGTQSSTHEEMECSTSNETNLAETNPTDTNQKETSQTGIGPTEGKATETNPIGPNKEKVHRNIKLSDITCPDDLQTLTVKELKTLLMTNRTDYKGCVERAELIEKAKRLWSDYTMSRRDLEKLSLEELCKICMDAPIECVLLECGHMASCMTCGKQLSECPMCRQYVVRCVRTFKV